MVGVCTTVENAVPNVAPSHMKVGKLEGGGNAYVQDIIRPYG